MSSTGKVREPGLYGAFKGFWGRRCFQQGLGQTPEFLWQHHDRAGLVLAPVAPHHSAAAWVEMKGFVVWCFLQMLINLKDVLDSLCPPVSAAKCGMVRKALCSSGFKATWINLGFNKQKTDEMVRRFSLYICLRLSAVQKNDKLHQTEPVIGGRVFFNVSFQESCY